MKKEATRLLKTDKRNLAGNDRSIVHDVDATWHYTSCTALHAQWGGALVERQVSEEMIDDVLVTRLKLDME
jgi:hypothetical protein